MTQHATALPEQSRQCNVVYLLYYRTIIRDVSSNKWGVQETEGDEKVLAQGLLPITHSVLWSVGKENCLTGNLPLLSAK